MAAIDFPTAAESREDYDINNPWTDPINGGEWWFSPTKVRWLPVPAGGGASVSDTAYDATSWNGVTDEAPSKNAVRDKFESLPTVTVDTTITDGSTNAVSSNAVFDALALKAPLASPTFTGPVTAANADSGTGAEISSTSGTGAEISSNSGTYHATFGNTGIEQSFVARLKGAFGWIRGAFTGRIHPPDTLTGDQTWELPDASGTLALTSDINTLAKLDTIVADANLARTDAGQTFAGAQAFSGSVSVTGNTTVAGTSETGVALGTVTTAATIAITDGTLITATLTASAACVFTLPAVGAGKSFTLLLKQAAATGLGTATFGSTKWAGGTAPTITATAGRMDILTFVSDGAVWYGSIAQNYTP